jgi:lipopolysaccharide/colanic/teichoic acid biosynthesis glycosyltransferase
MRIQTPSSRATFRIRFSPVDVCLAALSPLLALYLRDAYILSHDGAITVGIYCLVSLAFSLIAFSAFGLRDGMPRYFSVRDATEIAKAVLIGELMTCAALFTFTRLEGVPRSTPVIHALILGAALVSARALARIAHRDRKLADRQHLARQHVIIVGLNDLSSFYMTFLETFASDRLRAIAALDRDPRSIGRSIDGVRVIGPPTHLQSVIEEFAVHGVHTDRVVIGGEADILSDEELREIQRVCAQKNIDLEFVPRLFGLGPTKAPEQLTAASVQAPANPEPAPPFALPYYFRLKRFIDFFAALVMIVVFSPLWILVALLAFLDVGSPILFWQQRTGLNGSSFLLYKIRTLRPPFDWRGQRVRQEQRLSWVGWLLRETRLDELPQLMNVLVGDMSMIGPRPLLPQDQPPTPTVRLMVRPGITGWAQVNGATLLSPKEKEALDEWYIRNASPWLDLRIAVLTLLRLVEGPRRTGQTPAQERLVRNGRTGHERPARLQRTRSRFSASTVRPVLKDESPPPAMHS